MNPLDDRELSWIFNTIPVRTADLVPGDIIRDDFGCWMVVTVRETSPGEWDVLDYLNCGGSGYSPDDEHSVIDKSYLRAVAIEWLLESQIDEAKRFYADRT